MLLVTKMISRMIAFLVLAICASVVFAHGPGVGHGSHSHMKNPPGHGNYRTPQPHKPHEHYRPDPNAQAPSKITQDKQLLHDEDHLQEDLAAMMPEIDISKLTDAEKDFYYFKLHDYDGNLKLDGLELYSAISHVLPEPEFSPEDSEEVRKKKIQEVQRINEMSMKTYVRMIDSLLEDDDKDKDGYLSYSEYILGKAGRN